MTLKVGITGGIGSGKTTVCHIFESFGIPVYYADSAAKRLMLRNKKLKDDIKKLLGKEAYYKNGRLNRAFVASKVFNDKKLLKNLNQLVHPCVHQDANEWFAHQKTKYALYEAAILFESNGYKSMDKVITVIADEEVRLQRVINRDKHSAKAIKARMKNQWQDHQRIPLSDFIIDNNGSKSLIKQVNKIHHQLI